MSFHIHSIHSMYQHVVLVLLDHQSFVQAIEIVDDIAGFNSQRPQARVYQEISI